MPYTLTGGAGSSPTADPSQDNGGDGLITVSYEYSPTGRLTALTDDNSHRSRWTYDAVGRKLTEKKGIVVSGGSESYTNATTISWSYSASTGQLVSMTREDGKVITYTFNGTTGLLISEDASGTGLIGTASKSYTYDALGRRATALDDNDLPAGYGGYGHDVISRWWRDSLGRVVAESTQIGSGDIQLVTRDYVGSEVASMFYPNGWALEYAYDEAGRTEALMEDPTGSSLQDIATFEYQGGRTKKKTMASGTALQVAMDALGRPTEHKWTGIDGSGDVGEGITWDKAGNKLAVKRLESVRESQRYAYDAAGRLTSYLRGQIPSGAIAPGSAAYCNDPVNPALSGMQQMKRWGFDGLGNWIYTRQQTGEIVTAEQRMANAFNAYTAINKAGTTVNPSYNANGELEYDGEYNYIWDAWGRLTMIADDNYWEDPVARFVYDADNRQVRRMDFYSHEEGTNWAAHVYDYAYSGWRVLEEEKYRASYDNSSGYIDGFTDLGFRQNIYGNYLDEVIAVQIDGNGDGEAHEAVHDEDSTTGPDHRYYYCHNTLYSVIAITDEDADLVERYAYDPYGETYIYNSAGTKIAASLIDNVFTFTGQRFDSSLNANGYPKYLYYKNRYYLIPFGRFMSRDPIGYADNVNLHSYVFNNSINYVDPLGLWTARPPTRPGRGRPGAGPVGIPGYDYLVPRRPQHPLREPPYNRPNPPHYCSDPATCKGPDPERFPYPYPQPENDPMPPPTSDQVDKAKEKCNNCKEKTGLPSCYSQFKGGGWSRSPVGAIFERFAREAAVEGIIMTGAKPTGEKGKRKIPCPGKGIKQGNRLYYVVSYSIQADNGYIYEAGPIGGGFDHVSVDQCYCCNENGNQSSMYKAKPHNDPSNW